MAKKVYQVEVRVMLEVEADNEDQIHELIDEMDYSFTPPPNMPDAIQNTEVRHYEIIGDPEVCRCQKCEAMRGE